MTKRVERLLEILKDKAYRKNRAVCDVDMDNARSFEGQLRLASELVKKEKPFFFEGDFFGFNRYLNVRVPVREGNVTPNYKRVVEMGFDGLKQEIKDSIEKHPEPEKKEYGNVLLKFLDLCEITAEKYRDFAKESGNIELYNALLKVPKKGAESFYEALVFMKLCIYMMRLCGASHLTLGRFDQYMYSFYLADKAKGVSDDEIFELVEAFFISLNFDTDIYHGVQQGDNGQSMVLGGFDENGESVYNELSKMCMEASLELCLIDPKINLRVGKNTPDELYEYATLLTKKGLGFPQYCNDDVVVPGLIKLGYEKEDAIDYTVAACWEYIIPGKGADVPNFGVMDFPAVVNRAVENNLISCDSFDELTKCVEKEIIAECDSIIKSRYAHKFLPVPILSIFMDGCIENLTDSFSQGTQYNNFGCHGTGIANASDALAAIKKNVYDEKTISREEILNALKKNFEGCEEIRNLLKESPKMGNNDDYVDDIAAMLMDVFAENMNGRENGLGGIWRAGTGSAMEYLLKGKKCPATADGRKAGESYSSSFSPSLDVKPSGLLSVIQSFTKFDMTKIINGGPLTIEIHDSVLRNDIGIKKTAMLVKNFILLGGHQLQLNSINRETLIDAQNNPEKYPNLIVRVWGWSGYFNELDKEYQDHIMRRLEYMG